MPLPPRISKNLPKPAKKQREGMSDKHLKMVRQLACVACGNGGGGALPRIHAGIEAHHLLRSGEHGIGKRSSDRWAIPLCFRCHRLLHGAGDEDTFLANRGVDGRAVATALWGARGDLDAMRRIVFRTRQEARLKIKELDALLGHLNG